MKRDTPRSKADFYSRWFLGEFGNRPRSWDAWWKLRDSSYSGQVTARSKIPGGPCIYGVYSDALRDILGRIDETAYVYSETMPDDELTIQGNLWLDVGGLALEYSTTPGLRHREAVIGPPHTRTARGVMVPLLLKLHVDPPSYDDLMELIETYDDATIEFSSYRVPVGILDNRNTIVWEVRGY